MRSTGLGAILLLMLAACSSGSGSDVAPKTDAAGVLASVDWSQAQTVDVALSDFRFAPERVTLKAKTPYVLRLKNVGSGTHAFTAPKFFAASVVQKVVSAAGEQPNPAAVRDVEVRAGSTTEIYLVPGPSGTYDLTCSEFLHDLFGMNGKIVVE